MQVESLVFILEMLYELNFMIRIVKMTFDPTKVDEFLSNFDEVKHLIRNFDGVEHLSLLRDKTHPHIFFTYSHWQSEQRLENYRNSDLFNRVWNKTKPLFIAKAEAWSVDEIIKIS